MVDREKSGKDIFDQGLVECSGAEFTIKGKPYKITQESCTCPDYLMRHETCKHIFAVKFYIVKNGMKPTKKVNLKPFQDMIQFMESKGNVVSAIELYDKYDDLVDEACEKKIILKTTKEFILP